MYVIQNYFDMEKPFVTWVVFFIILNFRNNSFTGFAKIVKKDICIFIQKN